MQQVIPEEQHRRLDVLQQLNGATLALEERLCTVHDLPDDLLQVCLLLEQVVDHLQERLKIRGKKKKTYSWHDSQHSIAYASLQLEKLSAHMSKEPLNKDVLLRSAVGT